MARAPLTRSLLDPERAREPLPPVEVELGEDAPSDPRVSLTPDGGSIVDFAPYLNRHQNDGKFDGNLAELLDPTELAGIAGDLMAGIQADDDSRQEWLQAYAEGIDLLGFRLDGGRTSSGAASSAPLEGMSTARHPLLAEACVQFQAIAGGELLPAFGPAKVRDDQPPPPPQAAPMPFGGPGGAAPPVPPPPFAGPQPGMAGPAGPMPPQPGMPPHPMPGAPVPPPPVPQQPPQPSMVPGLPMPGPGENQKSDRDLLADALERDFNHYLTTTATEYYPDTTRMVWGVGFGGQGVKKVYNCPRRRRPVSESIAMEDFIVSNALTDLKDSGRITHRINMRPSVFRQMQLLGVYRDVEIGDPIQQPLSDPVSDAKAQTIGITPRYSNPKDANYEIYECYCELELDQFAPKHFRGKGLPLPYRVTIEKESQTILEIRRNWRENDKECVAREFFVDFSYIKAFGFYGIGLLHLLGNTTKTLTAIVRLFIDAGMFANFPGFMFAKGAGRQLTNQFRVGPGQGIGLDVGLQPIDKAVMPLPYKDLTPAFVQFASHLEDLGRRLGGIANVEVGEGKQDAPVGTTLALIEQATKPMGAVLKGLHASQGRELQLLAERFRDDPEAFWRFNKSPAMPWQKEQFLKALEDFNLVPVSDPNNPTKLHRAAKSAMLVQIAQTAPGLLNPQKVFTRIAAAMDIEDPEDLFAPPMPPQQQGGKQQQNDPSKMASVQAKAQGDQLRAQTDMAQAQLEAQSKAAEMQSRIQLAMIEQQTERLRLASTIAIHSDKTQSAMNVLSTKIGADQASQMRDHLHEHIQNTMDRGHDAQQADIDRQHAAAMQPPLPDDNNQ